MKTIHLLSILALAICLTSCTKETSPDEKAAVLLQKSRLHLTEGRYDAARDSILSLRKQYPTAVQTRAKALLLLDSIEITAAYDSLGSATGEEWKRLSVKKEFFERKLQEDKKKLGIE